MSRKIAPEEFISIIESSDAIEIDGGAMLQGNFIDDGLFEAVETDYEGLVYETVFNIDDIESVEVENENGSCVMIVKLKNGERYKIKAFKITNIVDCEKM